MMTRAEKARALIRPTQPFTPAAMMPPEEIRFEVRRHLYARPTASLDIDSIVHGLRRKGLDADKHEVGAALVFLEGLNPPQVAALPGELGPTKRYQITSAGVLAYESNT